MRFWRAVVLLAVVPAACTPVTTSVPVGPPVEAARPAEPPVTAPAARPRGVRPVRSFQEVRGLWVVRSTMTSEEEVRSMVADAAAAGFNTLIVQVRGRGDAFYRSAIEPRAETMEGPPDFDPLALTIREAHLRGMAVHAWVNTHLVWGSATLPASPRHIVNEHPEWLAVPQSLAGDLYWMDPKDPRFVQALRRYAADRPETVEGMYTSPSSPDVKERVYSVWMDLIDRYDLDGIHFDYIRFPSRDFDYSRGALERFQAWVSLQLPADRLHELEARVLSDPLAFATALPEEWDTFRREQITGLVRWIYTAVKTRRPELVVSAAVVADSPTAYGHRFQDWEEWLQEGILDIAVPMAYTPDNATFQRQVRNARSAAGSRGRIWAGIGAYMNSVDGTLDKIDLARAEDTGGVVLFSYDWAANEGRGDPAHPFLEQVGRERFGSD
jgi:uncharacterized lipoprotein YddW (UPF0748 family)